MKTLKMRVEGPELDVQEGIEKIKEVMRVAGYSKPYHNRDNDDVRIYLDVEFPEPEAEPEAE